MSQLLDLQVEIAARPPDASSETAAPITLRCEALKLKHEEGMFSYPLTKNERDDLRWYLEDYWKWPFAGFAQRGSTVEQLLPALGQRLYQAAFGEGAARDIIQQWQADTSGAHQVSIITTDAGFLSLPWELLHDGQDFLALQANPPISIVRRIAEERQPSTPEVAFEKPLRVLLVTARPVDEGQVDVRTIAREVLDVLQDQREAGTIELEFLRPPTFDKLITRLSEKERPVHVLHFDGHGVFYRFPGGQDGNNEERGRLFFENDDGKGDPVDAVSLAEMLCYGGVQVAILNACQSAAIGEKDIFSSMAVQLLQGSVQAVVAMSARVMTTSAALYVKAFYGALTAGGSVQAAHEQAQQALHEHPERNPLQRRLDEAGTPVNLQDWWLPYLYLQRPLALQPMREGPEPQQLLSTPTAPRLNSALPDPPPYEFSGRSAELLHIERSLLPKKDGARRVVVISGFGGIGKTALAREVADWLTRTKMFATACFVSFEQGGDAITLLHKLGVDLDVNDSNYDPNDPRAALEQLEPLLKQRHLLIIVDNMESVLPGGNAPLTVEARTELYNILLELRRIGAGVLLTSRGTAFEDNRLAPGNQAIHLALGGLYPEDAYALASHLLTDLGIDRKHVPYVELRDLLKQLDHHPLAIQVVLPVLRELPISKIKTDFATLLPKFVDDTVTGRNQSLLASLAYSLQRLSAEQRALLSRLALFEGGANEIELLAITEIPESEWATLRLALGQAALLTVERVHKDVAIPFLHFHPVLTPYLRSHDKVADVGLRERYVQRYSALVDYLYHEDNRNPQPVRALASRELPNLRRVLKLLEEAGEADAFSTMAYHVIRFLNYSGLERERDDLLRRIPLPAVPQVSATLTQREYEHEATLGEDERAKGNLRAACDRFMALLARIEALQEGTPLGRGSFAHYQTLAQLARCLLESGQPAIAENRQREALAIIEALIRQHPEDQDFLRERGVLLTDLGVMLSAQGAYQQAQAAYEKALQIAEEQGSMRDQDVALTRLGSLALRRDRYAEARAYYERVLDIDRKLGEPALQVATLYQLGALAEVQENWDEAQRWYRESLVLEEQKSNVARISWTYSRLAHVAEAVERPAEAEGWLKRALELDEQVYSGGPEHAGHLSDLATLLLKEIQVGRVPLTRLQEVRDYAERALAIRETLNVSEGIWATLHILADIAHQEGRAEAERDYRRREREAYIAFAGNHDEINRRFGSLTVSIAAAALGNPQARAEVEEKIKRYGSENKPLAATIWRLWAGEHNWDALVEHLDGAQALLMLYVLEILAQSMPTQGRTPAQAMASWPLALQEAMNSGDTAAFEQALDALPPEEQQKVIEEINSLLEQDKRAEEEVEP